MVAKHSTDGVLLALWPWGGKDKNKGGGGTGYGQCLAEKSGVRGIFQVVVAAYQKKVKVKRRKKKSGRPHCTRHQKVEKAKKSSKNQIVNLERRSELREKRK